MCRMSGDGYQAQRSYSIASAPEDSEQVALTVERIEDVIYWGQLDRLAGRGASAPPAGRSLRWALSSCI